MIKCHVHHILPIQSGPVLLQTAPLPTMVEGPLQAKLRHSLKGQKLEFKSREVFYIAARIKQLNAGVHGRDGYTVFCGNPFLHACVFRGSSLPLLFQCYPYTSSAPLFTKLLCFWSTGVGNL